MRQPRSWWLVLAGLLTLMAWLVLSPPGAAGSTAGGAQWLGVLLATPLGLLVAAGMRNRPRWGLWVAVLMVPYVMFSVGAMLVASPGGIRNAIFPSIAVVVFFAGLDCARRAQLTRRQ